MLVVTRNDKALRAPLRALLASRDHPDGLFVNVHDRPGPFMVGNETIRIHGRPQVRETLRNTSFLVSPDAFFQTSPQAAGHLVGLVTDWLAPTRDDDVLDLYCGGGLLTLPLALRARSALGVELSVRRTHANA